MDINSFSIAQLAEYVNAELGKGRTLKDIEIQDFKVNPRVIGKRLARKDYKKVDNEYIKIAKKEVKSIDNTSSTTPPGTLKNIDIDKLNLLLENLEPLLNLVRKRDNTSSTTIQSKETRVTSLRINKELYDLVKDRALRDNISISDIVNRALLDYLSNYI